MTSLIRSVEIASKYDRYRYRYVLYVWNMASGKGYTKFNIRRKTYPPLHYIIGYENSDEGISCTDQSVDYEEKFFESAKW